MSLYLMNMSVMYINDKKVHLGIISSAGGSVLKELAGLRDVVDLELKVVTDRTCGTEELCRNLSIACERIEENDNALFSRRSAAHFSSAGGVDAVLLFFTRIVTADLFGVYPTFNIHPSLLPAFRGFKPLEQAARAGVKILGATLHVVDENVDAGPIIAQVANPIQGYDLPYLEKISFLQKTLLAYLLVDLLASDDVLFNSGRVEVRRNLSGGGVYNPPIKNPAILDVFGGQRRKMD